MLRAIPNELIEKARFAFVKAFGMKGLGEPEEFVVEVVADFVEEGPQKRTAKRKRRLSSPSHFLADDAAESSFVDGLA